MIAPDSLRGRLCGLLTRKEVIEYFGGCLFGVTRHRKKWVNMRVTAKQSLIFSECTQQRKVPKTLNFANLFLLRPNFLEKGKKVPFLQILANGFLVAPKNKAGGTFQVLCYVRNNRIHGKRKCTSQDNKGTLRSWIPWLRLCGTCGKNSGGNKNS